MAYRANMPIRTEVRSSSDGGRCDYVLTWDDLVYLHLNRLALFAQPAQDDYATPCPGYEPGPADTTPPVRFRARTAPTTARLNQRCTLLLEPLVCLLQWMHLWALPSPYETYSSWSLQLDFRNGCAYGSRRAPL